MKFTKQILIIIIVIYNIESSLISNKFSSKYKLLMNNKSSNKIKQDKIEIKNEGWFSYIKYEKDSSDIPNYLYKNPSYIDQLKYEEINNNTDKVKNTYNI